MIARAALASRLEALFRWRFLPVALALVGVLGAKLYLIGLAANPTPFWDQWDAEGAHLFTPYVEGHLGLHDLLAPHNEHRILFTRLLALGVLELSGSWNVVAEMIANAVVHLLVLAILVYLLRRGAAFAPGLIASFTLLLFAVPFGIENTLWGFQSQFYFVLLLSLPAVTLLAGSATLTARWWAGVALATLAYWAMASGALTPAAGGAVMLVQIAAGVRARRPREIIAACMLIGVTVALIAATQLPPDTGHSRATGLMQLLGALSRAAGWPLRGPIIAPLLLNAPTIALLVATLRRHRPIEALEWRLVAMLGWVELQCASLAYGRAAAAVMSRYLDVLALGVLLNLVALVVLLASQARRYSLVAAGWTALVAGALVVTAAVTIPRSYLLDADAARSRTQSLQRFVATGDARAFDRPTFEAPYPSATGLAQMAGRPALKGLLPPPFPVAPALRSGVTARLALRGGFGLEPDRAKRGALYLGALLLALGAALSLAGAAFRYGRLTGGRP